MTESIIKRLEQLVGNVDKALAENPALTDEQFQDVERLRAELQEACRVGKIEEAERCEKLALQIIRKGPPAPK